jgi:hypothetical protein
MKNLETDDVEIIDRHSVRITVLGKGTFDEFTARLEKILPISTPAEIVREAKTWDDVVNKVEIKAPLGLFIYRKGPVHAVLGLAGHKRKCSTYLIGNFTVAEKTYTVAPSGFQYFPFQTCVWEGADGRPRFSFDQPSKVVEFFGSDRMTKVAREFDFLFGKLLEALGCTVPDVLR